MIVPIRQKWANRTSTAKKKNNRAQHKLYKHATTSRNHVGCGVMCVDDVYEKKTAHKPNSFTESDRNYSEQRRGWRRWRKNNHTHVLINLSFHSITHVKHVCHNWIYTFVCIGTHIRLRENGALTRQATLCVRPCCHPNLLLICNVSPPQCHPLNQTCWCCSDTGKPDARPSTRS